MHFRNLVNILNLVDLYNEDHQMYTDLFDGTMTVSNISLIPEDSIAGRYLKSLGAYVDSPLWLVKL